MSVSNHRAGVAWQYDAFISYSHRDGADFAWSLHERLECDGIKCFIDKHPDDLLPTTSFPHEIASAVVTSRYHIVVLTPGYCDSAWTQKELAVFFADEDAAKERLIVLYVFEVVDMPPLLRDIQFIDCRKTEDYEPVYRATRNIIEISWQSNRDGAWPPTPFGLMQPSLGKRFVGRDQDLIELHELILGGYQSCVAVEGMPGVGKTQLAIEYAHLHSRNYPGGVFWIDAEHTPRLVAFRTIAGWARIPWLEGEKEDIQIQAFWRELAGLPRSLIVLDNFPEVAHDEEYLALRPWLPPGGDIHVLVTSRRCLTDTIRYPIQSLDKEAGFLLLTADSPPSSKVDVHAAYDLIDDLGCLPLALEIVRAYVQRHQSMSFNEYRDILLTRNTIEVIERMSQDYLEPLPTGRTACFLAVFEQSYSKCSELAQMVLSVMACIAPEPVPIDFIKDVICAYRETDDPDVIPNPIHIALDELKEHSLIRWTDGNIDKASLQRPVAHRLVLEFALQKTQILPVIGIVEVALDQSLLRMRRILDRRDIESVRILQDFVPHATVAQQHAADIGAWNLAFELADCLSRYWFEWGNYADAVQWAQVTNKATKHLKQRAHKQGQIRALLALARATRHESGSGEALAIFRKAYDLVCGYSHASTVLRAEVMSDLGMALRDTDRSSEALPILEEALDLTSPGKDFDLSYVRSSILLHLGEVLADLGHLVEGRSMLEQVVVLRSEILGPNHFDTAWSQHRLGKVLRSLGRAEEALPMIMQSLEIVTRERGLKHPYTIRGRGHLAMVLRDMGMLPEARQVLQSALADLEDRKHIHHPTTARLFGFLALVEADLDHADEAVTLAQQAIEIQQQAFHSDEVGGLAFRGYELAYALRGAGRLRNAELELNKAMQALRAKFEFKVDVSAHPDNARHLQLLALIHADLGKWDKSILEAEEALHILEQRIGIEEPRTTKARELVEWINMQAVALRNTHDPPRII